MTKDLIRVGFWAPANSIAPDAAGNPPVNHFIDYNWRKNNVREYLEVVHHLSKRSREHAAYKGMAPCRLCPNNHSNGSCDMTDGTYVWPEGYLHYILEHHVKPPRDFIDHVLFFDAKREPSPQYQETLERLWGGRSGCTK